MTQNRAVLGVNLGTMWDATDITRPQVEALLQLALEGKIRPKVDRAFAFAEAAQAHRYIQERKNIGKVVLTP